MNSPPAGNLYGLRKIQSRLFGFFILLLLLLLNGSAWWLYQKVDDSLNAIFSRSFEESAQLSAESLSYFPNLNGPPPRKNSIQYIQLQARLVELKDAGNFTDIFLLDTQLRNYIGVYSDFKIGDKDNLLLALNQTYLDQSLKGKTVSTPEFEVEGLYIKTAFTPVFGPLGEIQNILVVNADVEYIKPKIAIRNTLIGISLMNSLFLLLLALAYGKSQLRIQKNEEKIVHNEQLASLGRMAAGIAHELRNPLGIIEQTMTVLRRRYEKEPDEMFEFIPSEVSRMNRIITEFLDIAKQSTLNLQRENLTDRLESTLNMMEFQFKEKQITLTKEFPPHVETLMDRDKMHQVFLNLFMNAVDAMPEGGNLNVRISNQDKELICTEIEDTGSGISIQDADKIFEPFFTTKETGTGLGLSVAARIVEQQGGQLVLDKTWKNGTRMKVYLRKYRSKLN